MNRENKVEQFSKNDTFLYIKPQVKAIQIKCHLSQYDFVSFTGYRSPKERCNWAFGVGWVETHMLWDILSRTSEIYSLCDWFVAACGLELSWETGHALLAGRKQEASFLFSLSHFFLPLFLTLNTLLPFSLFYPSHCHLDLGNISYPSWSLFLLIRLWLLSLADFCFICLYLYVLWSFQAKQIFRLFISAYHF